MAKYYIDKKQGYVAITEGPPNKWMLSPQEDEVIAFWNIGINSDSELEDWQISKAEKLLDLLNNPNRNEKNKYLVFFGIKFVAVIKKELPIDRYLSVTDDIVIAHWGYVHGWGGIIISDWQTSKANTLCALLNSHGIVEDAVDHPCHYNKGNMEVIDAIEGLGLGFLEGNILKYISRYKLKGGVEDLHKAKWYLERLINQNKEQKC